MFLNITLRKRNYLTTVVTSNAVIKQTTRVQQNSRINERNQLENYHRYQNRLQKKVTTLTKEMISNCVTTMLSMLL